MLGLLLAVGHVEGLLSGWWVDGGGMRQRCEDDLDLAGDGSGNEKTKNPTFILDQAADSNFVP